MSELELEKFRALFPEFKDKVKYPDVVINLYFDVAKELITAQGGACDALSPAQAELARYYMTAHLMAIANQQSADTEQGASTDQGGFITSGTIGEISVAKLAPPAKDGWEWWLATTPYGSALLAILKLLSVGGFYIGGLPEREGFAKVGGIYW